MTNVAVFALYGDSNSGKTELMVRLLEDFTREGLRVCTVKHSSHKDILDQEGKDTYRYGQAGSDLRVLVTKEETGFLVGEQMGLEEITNLVSSFGNFDLLLAEGFSKKESVAKILVGEAKERANTVHRFRGDYGKLKELILDEVETRKIQAKLPGLNCGRCGFPDCRSLAKDIYRKEKTTHDCPVLREENLNLRINGEEVALGDFPSRILKGGIIGMLRELKGIGGKVESFSVQLKD